MKHKVLMIISRFKSFNSQFEEIHQRQSEWIITHSELRESVRLSVNEILQPAYRSFLKRYRSVFLYPN